MKTCRKIVLWALWLFLSTILFITSTFSASFMNGKPITALLNYHLWNETDIFCVLGLLSVSIIAGLVVTLLLLELVRQEGRKKTLAKLLATQKN